jgi:antitoxin VapB
VSISGPNNQERSYRTAGPSGSGETGESVAEVIQKSLEERWERLKRQRKGQIDDLLCRVDALPSQNSQSENEILGYDENGIPR